MALRAAPRRRAASRRPRRRRATSTRSPPRCRATHVVIHLASNPDIAAAMTRPRHRLRRGHRAHTRASSRRCGAADAARSSTRREAACTAISASSRPREDHGPLVPTSTYGASKLAGEAMIASYTAMFGLGGCAFRFGNVVGPRQTHGVGFDFVRKLLADPTRPRDPRRRHAEQVVHPRARRGRGRAARRPTHDRAVRGLQRRDRRLHHGRARSPTSPSSASGSTRHPSRYEFTGGDRGWKGDVPIVRLNTDRSVGSAGERSSDPRDALRARDRGACSPKPARPARGLARRAQRRCSSIVTACSIAALVVDGVPHPPAAPRSWSCCRASSRRARQLRDAGLPARRRHEPTRHRPRVVARAERSTRQRGAARAALPLDDIVVLPARRRRWVRVPQAHAGHARRRRRRSRRSTSRRSVMVGDRWRDIEAGQAAGCRTVFVDHGYAERSAVEPRSRRFASLVEAVPGSSSTMRATQSDERKTCSDGNRPRA